jgi:hypothetical protein
MQSPAPTASPTPSSFAGFLAALTQPGRAEIDRPKPPIRAHVWNDDLLADDVATLSYEQALRAHARYHADDPVVDQEMAAPPALVEVAAPQPEAVFSVPSAPEKILKEASITIRLSSEENAQLRRLAAEAGLTVSAYIRSCTFEAESLRALVKDTISQLRTPGTSLQPEPAPQSPRPRHWSSLFWPGRRDAHGNVENQA